MWSTRASAARSNLASHLQVEKGFQAAAKSRWAFGLEPCHEPAAARPKRRRAQTPELQRDNSQTATKVHEAKLEVAPRRAQSVRFQSPRRHAEDTPRTSGREHRAAAQAGGGGITAKTSQPLAARCSRTGPKEFRAVRPRRLRAVRSKRPTEQGPDPH